MGRTPTALPRGKQWSEEDDGEESDDSDDDSDGDEE
jgi:hypothetical protein